MCVGAVMLSQKYSIDLLNVFVGVVLLSQQYGIDLLNLCGCCHVISTVQHRSVKSLRVLSCYFNSIV